MLSKDELLKDRYKVIAPYPGSELPVGCILTNTYSGLWSDGKGIEFFENKNWFEKYPHLFRKLEWFEERDVNDMPKYVRVFDTVYKIERWEGNSGVTSKSTKTYRHSINTVLNTEVLPATSEEYLTYLNQLNAK